MPTNIEMTKAIALFKKHTDAKYDYIEETLSNLINSSCIIDKKRIDLKRKIDDGVYVYIKRIRSKSI